MVHSAVPEVRELKEALEKYGISAAEAARYIGAAVKTVYNWVQKVTVPSALMRTQIRAGLERMEKELGAPLSVKIYHTRRAVWDRLSHDQKETLMALVGVDGFQEKYLAELEKHAAKLGVTVIVPAGGRVPDRPPAPAVKPKPKPEPKPEPPAGPRVSEAELRNLEAQFRRAKKIRRAEIVSVLKTLGVEPLPAWATEPEK